MSTKISLIAQKFCEKKLDNNCGVHRIWLIRLMKKCSPVAQSVERLAVNQLVAGSSPARGATFQAVFRQGKQPFLLHCFTALKCRQRRQIPLLGGARGGLFRLAASQRQKPTPNPSLEGSLRLRRMKSIYVGGAGSKYSEHDTSSASDS